MSKKTGIFKLFRTLENKKLESVANKFLKVTMCIGVFCGLLQVEYLYFWHYLPWYSASSWPSAVIRRFFLNYFIIAYLVNVVFYGIMFLIDKILIYKNR